VGEGGGCWRRYLDFGAADGVGLRTVWGRGCGRVVELRCGEVPGGAVFGDGVLGLGFEFAEGFGVVSGRVPGAGEGVGVTDGGV